MDAFLLTVIGIFSVLGLLAWIEQVTRPRVESNDDWTSESRGASRW